MKRLSCVIFDLDGTLADTGRLIFASFNHIAERYTGRAWSEQEILATFGPTEEVFTYELLQKTYGGRLTILSEVADAVRQKG